MKTKMTFIITIILFFALFASFSGISMAAPAFQAPTPMDLESTPTPGVPPMYPFDDGEEGEPDRKMDRLVENYPLVEDWSSIAFPIEGLNLPIESLTTPFIPTAVSAGLSFSCALSTDGAVKCWGDNWRGRLGDGALVNHYTPVDVYSLSHNVVKLSTWHKHTCVLMNTGGMKCWGYNLHGELGNGTTIDSLIPIDVYGLTSGVVDIAVGGFHTCALLNTGKVKCWGANWHGQVGNANHDDQYKPVDVVNLSGVKAVEAGKYHTCALLNSGGIKCWGYNVYGQLGNNTTDMVQATPVSVKGFENYGAKEISLGAIHTCAVTTNGGVKCWGDNSEGELGLGNRQDFWKPTDFVLGLDHGVAGISAGSFYTCAKLETTGAKCWGNNWAGQLGDGTNNRRTSPVDVAISGQVTYIDTGDSHTCAVAGTKVKCWGSNSNGQLGDGSSALRLTPVYVASLSNGIKAITTGGLHACALTAAGGVKCWGNNDYGQLGDYTKIDRLSPVDVYGLTSDVIAISAGAYHTCAVKAGGGVWCWGDNHYGQLGNNTTSDSLIPDNVTALASGAIAVAAGYNHTCALMAGGGIKCWGDNRKGQLGDRTKLQRLKPVFVLGLNGDAVQISAGERHTCARMSTGSMKCWGFNFYGQIGDGAQTDRWEPVNVTGLSSGVTDISAGVQHTCAVVNGGLKCWGGNYFGQLGNGTFDLHATPIAVPGLDNGVISVTAGGYHTCTIMNGGSGKCWGDNSSGQTGDNTTFWHLTPVDVEGLPGSLSAITGGTYFTCGIVEGKAMCWGAHGNGQIGDGSIPWKTIPSFVLGFNPTTLIASCQTGQPGSTFLFNGTNFPPDGSAQVIINGYTYSQTVPIDVDGALSFLVTTDNANEGGYIVITNDILNATARFILNATDSCESSGGSVTFALPENLGFLYSINLPYVSR